MNGDSILATGPSQRDLKSTKGQWRRDLAFQWAILGAVLIALLAGLQYWKLLAPLDRMAYDTILQVRGGTTDPRILIVAIDDASLNALGPWPWPRATHAQLLDKIASAQPKAVAFDFGFSGTAPSNDDERLLTESLARFPHVFLPEFGTTKDGNRSRATQSDLQANDAPGTTVQRGHIHPEADPDGVVRSAFLKEGVNGQWSTHMMWKLMSVGSNEDPKLPGERRPARGAWQHDRGINNFLLRDYRVHFPFAGPPNTYRMVSYSDVLSGSVPLDGFKGKYVLIGTTAPQLSDQYAVPISGPSGFMSEVEINANLLDSLLNHKTTQSLPIFLSIGLAILILALVLVAIPRLEGLSVVLGLLFTMVLCAALLLNLGRWFAPSAVMTLTVLAYPIWDWRRLLSVRKLLASELQLFQGEHHGLNRLPLDKKQSTAATILDQMDLLVWARAEIAASQRQRKNTIELLGHDIRGPQVAIMGLLDLQNFPNKALPPNQLYQAIRFQSKRSLSLLDDLMQLVNAESGSFQKVSRAMADVLHEAVDQCWALAKAREVNLVQHVMATETWVQMDPAMMNRALVNLINNAINFSEPGTTVKCTLWRVDESPTAPKSEINGPRILVSIADQGCGIAPEHLPRLYQWRQRFHAHEEGRPAGFGLGLAFVKAAVDSHGGRIRCKSKVGVGTTFIISLAADTSASIWGPEILNPSYLDRQEASPSSNA